MDFEFNLTEDEYNICKEFAEKSALTQREYRSGGSQIRNTNLISSDTFRGKVGEVIVKKFLEQIPLNITGISLDFEIYPRGKWDSQDIIINDKTISIKSVKWFSKWLLLESKDINRGDVYDYYILVTVNKDLKSGTVKGFVRKENLSDAQKTVLLKKGDYLPNTNTILDADNHGIKQENLNNELKDWEHNFKL